MRAHNSISSPRELLKFRECRAQFPSLGSSWGSTRHNLAGSWANTISHRQYFTLKVVGDRLVLDLEIVRKQIGNNANSLGRMRICSWTRWAELIRFLRWTRNRICSSRDLNWIVLTERERKTNRSFLTGQFRKPYLFPRTINIYRARKCAQKSQENSHYILTVFARERI